MDGRERMDRTTHVVRMELEGEHHEVHGEHKARAEGVRRAETALDTFLLGMAIIQVLTP